jgi:hypothetical protein
LVVTVEQAEVVALVLLEVQVLQLVVLVETVLHPL